MEENFESTLPIQRNNRLSKIALILSVFAPVSVLLTLIPNEEHSPLLLLVGSIFGLVGVIGLIIALYALYKIRKGEQTGKKLAIAAIVIALIPVALNFIGGFHDGLTSELNN